MRSESIIGIISLPAHEPRGPLAAAADAQRSEHPHQYQDSPEGNQGGGRKPAGFGQRARGGTSSTGLRGVRGLRGPHGGRKGRAGCGGGASGSVGGGAGGRAGSGKCITFTTRDGRVEVDG